MNQFFTLLVGLAFLLYTSLSSAQCSCTAGIGDQSSLELYWTGSNSNNYNDICNWRLNGVTGTEFPCQAPRSSDNVHFMNASFSGTANIVHIDQNSNCRNMTWDNTITAAKNVRLTGTSSGTLLDIYGNLSMATNMNITGFFGKLRFTSTLPGGVSTFLSRGHNFRLYDLEIALGANTELRLLDDLTVNNRFNNNVRQNEGGITLNSGHFNTNGKTVRADRFYSRTSSTSRRITIDNSTIILDGNLYTNSGWNINFNTTNNSGLSTTGSHIKLEGNLSNSATIQYYSFGRSVTYDSITISKEMGRHYVYPASNFTCNYLEIDEGMLPLGWKNSTINANTFKIGANAFTYNFKLITDNFIGPTGCATALLENVALQKRTTGGNLAINNIMAIKVRGVAGSTYSATTSYEGANCSAISFAPVTTCNSDLRFTGAVNNNWQDVNNWVNHTTNAPATHIPTPWSNVYFTSTSFSNVNNVQLNKPSFCKDMRWQGVPSNSDFRLTHQLFLNGTLELDPNMAPISETRFGYQYGRGFICLSPNNDSIITKGVYVNSSFHFTDYSRYNIVDTMHTPVLYQNGAYSHLTVNNANLQIKHYLIYNNSTWTNATVNYTGSGWTGIAVYGTPTYTNSTFYLNNAGNLMINAVLPNVVIQGRGKTFAHPRIHVRGDLRINTSSLSSMKDAYNYASNGRIIVSGDMHIAPGIDVMLNSNPGSYVRVQGNVFTSSNCKVGMTSIRTDIGNPVEFTVNGSGSNIQDVYLQALNASQGQPLVATNSTDGGNNTNITFSLGTGRTFYWVADRNGAANDFDGNWSNPDHWTTVATNTVGDGNCIPSIIDNVIFRHPNSRCIIDINAYCNNLDAQTAVTFGSSNVKNNWYIGGDWTTATGTVNNFYGILNFVGTGNITNNGVGFNCKNLVFNKLGGTWTLQDDLSLNRPINNLYYNHMILGAGTINSNGHDIFVRNRFTSNSNNARALMLDNSTFTIGGSANYNGYPRALWNTSNSANMTINGGLIHIKSLRNSNHKSIHFGDGNLQYDSVLVEANNYEMKVYGATNFNYAEWNADLLIYGSNSYDTLVINGGHTCRFSPNITQTLKAPHGKLKSKNVGPSSFINLETTSVGQTAYFFKEYGQSFCLNYIKVKDIRATKATTQPAACTLPDCWSLLEFQTDQNSDSISIANSDWGIWSFKLAPLINPISSGADTVIICKTGANLSYPIQITGTSPYIIDYSWQDANNPSTNGGQSGILVYDNDNNPNTPYTYNVPLNPIVNAFNYTVDIATTRCGERILSTPVQTHVIVPTPQPLVQTNRTGNCTFDNEGNWYSILDAVNDRPIVSLLDSIAPTDNDSLGLVNVNVYFEPTVQNLTFNGDVYPYLQRHWQIAPTNNHGAKVRIYFTKAELDALAAGSFAATYNGGVNPATELLVLKYNNGTFPTATTAPNVVIVPHSVVASNATSWAANPTAAAPFSTTNNIIALEFEVSSFSHFAVVLTQSALLKMPNLQQFGVKVYKDKQAKTWWKFDAVSDIANFTVQHTTDHQIIRDKGEVAVVAGQLNYQFIDPTPNLGINYYRLKSTNLDGTVRYSEWKTVSFKNSMLVNLFPNPTSGKLFMQLHSEQHSDLSWQITNSVGQVVLEGEQSLQIGMQTFELPTTPLTSGFYSIRISHATTGFVQQQNFIKD